MCCYVDGDVSGTLERLAARQKHRQYSAANVSSGVLSSASATQCSTADTAENVVGQTCKPKRVQSAYAWSQRTSAAGGRRKDVDLVELSDCEEDSADRNPDTKRVRRLRRSSATVRREVADPAEDCGEAESRKRVRRGSRRSSAVEADRLGGDGQTKATAGVNYYENQRCMIEESRALLEQSKAKHHALVAQAHSMQKRLRSHQITDPPVQLSESQTALAPKPPTAPPADKKPTSSFRTQRLARYDDCY